MDKRVGKKWVKALRSGQYEQGRNRLRNDDNRFCCLGVLCNLYAQEHPAAVKAEINPARFFGQIGYAPAAVLKWSKLTHEKQQILADKNDYGWTFKQIANYIEKELL